MPRHEGPSYTDLVYEALQAASHPLSFDEIFTAVNERRPITTRNPRATIRSALNQSKQLVRLGEGRYGYLPREAQGSLLRVVLTEKKPANHPLIFPDDVRYALWPSFFETKKRQNLRPVIARLPNGDEVSLGLEFFGQGRWGCRIPEGLRRYLAGSYAAPGDALLIRVLDAEAGRAELWFEPHRRRDRAAVAQRNRELADRAEVLFRDSRTLELPIWDLVIGLLARGAFRGEVAADPLETVLRADRRFVDAGFALWMLAEDVTPEIEVDIRRRKGAEKRFNQSLEEPATERSEISAVSLRRSMERSLLDVTSLLSEQHFESIDEANAFLHKILASGNLPHRAPTTPLERAQDLMYNAWEASRPADRIRLARQALQVCPDCADAYVLLAEETAQNAAQAAELYARGVAAGERALGPKIFEEAGHFWGIIETRPYMRARLGLAQALWVMGKRREAIDHAWALLQLNPNDNQGVRYELLSWLLATRDAEGVSRLLAQFPDDVAAVWLYGRALHRFATEGDSRQARELIAEARRANPFVPDYLLGTKRLPRVLPETVGLGDEKEAIYCTVTLLLAWRNTPGALAWLAAQPAAR